MNGLNVLPHVAVVGRQLQVLGRAQDDIDFRQLR
jgi:hypothetical protein